MMTYTIVILPLLLPRSTLDSTQENIEVGRVSVLDDNGCAAVYAGRRSGWALDGE